MATLTLSSSPARVLHQEAIQHYLQGKHEEALGLIELALKNEETSPRWNDFATMQLAIKNLEAAEAGYRRALELDPANQLAAANLVALLEGLGRDREAAQFLSAASPELVQKNRDAALLAVARTGNTQRLVTQLIKYVSRFPEQDPELSICMAEALKRARHSGFLARQCFALLSRLPREGACAVLIAFVLLAARDPIFHSVLALWHMNQGDYDRALAAFQKVFDSNPADLFAESMIIECQHQRRARCPTSPDPFEGIEDYLRDHFCEKPWRHFEVGADNGAYLCCPAWQPICIGMPSRASSEDIWHSDVAAEVRKSVLEGSFRYCSKVHCPGIAARNLPSRHSIPECFPELHAVLADEEAVPKPSTLVLSYDRTCNLACPQCRSSFYSASRAQQEQMERDYQQFILTVARDATAVTLDGSGEVFSSRHSRRILGLLKRDQYPNLKFSIISNGQLFDRRSFETFDLKGRLMQVDISIDAACPETYKVVRRGGDFNRLLRNLQFLDDLRIKEGEGFRLVLRFVVSAMNFREIPEFVTLARRFHADSILFTILRNWGCFRKGEFEQMNVASPTNPLHERFVEILDSPELLDPIVDMGSILTYRRITL